MSVMTNQRDDRLAEIAAEMPWVRRLAIAVAADAHTGEDIAQDVLLAASKPGARDAVNLRSWLAGAVRKLSLRRGRSAADRSARERQVARSEVLDDSTLAVERLEIQEALSQAVRELEEPYRSTVILRWFEGLEPKEIAQRTGVPVRTVHTRVTRALARLRETLDRRSQGDRSRWVAAWVPLLSTSNALKVSLMTFKVKLAIVCVSALVGVVAVIPRPGEDYDEHWTLYESGQMTHSTKHCYPRRSIFLPRVEEYSVEHLDMPNQPRVKLGPFTRWARNGQKLEEGNFEHDKRAGTWTFWNEDGSVDRARSGVYENDLKVGD